MNPESSTKLGFLSIILLGLNSIVGTGIFLLPGQVAALAGKGSILAYVFVTLIVLSIAWCFAKCASLYTRNGGAYLYAKEAFGNFVGFEVGLLRWVVCIITWAALAAGFVTALGIFFPTAMEEPYRSIIALSLINGLGIINIFGIGILKQLNNVVTVAKIIPLIAFILLGASYIDHTHLFPVIETVEWQTEGFSAAALIIFYAFSGFETLPIAASEMHNPRKNIPIAVFTVISICAFLYFFIQLIAMGVLGPALPHSQAPILDAAMAITGSYGAIIVGIAMLISIGGINIASSFLTPRAGVALAEDNLIPSIIARRNRHGAPYFAMFLSMAASSLFVISGTFVELVAISVVCRFFQYFSTCIAIIVFHQKGKIRAFDKIWKIIFPIIGIAGIIWLLWQATLGQLSWGIGAIALGIPLYYLQNKNYFSSPSLVKHNNNV